MIRKLLIFIFVVFSVCGSYVLPVFAESKTLLDDFLSEKGIDLEINAATDFYSKYIWRGMRLDDDYVIQPSMTVSGYGFELGVWSSFDIDQDDAINSDEVDTSLTYTHEIGDLGITVGHIYYDFPGAATFSKEAVLGFSYSTILSPSLTWYHDYSRESQGGGKGDYLVLELSHSLDLISEYGITLDLAGHVGYNKHLFINGEGGDVGISAGLSIPLTKQLAMAPSVNYSIPFGDVEDSQDGNHDDEFFWGVGFSYDL